MADGTAQDIHRFSSTAACGWRARVLGLLVAVALPFGGPVGGSAQAGGCTAPADLVTLHAPLPKLVGAVSGKSPLTIVALGSSSTWGAGASSRSHSYPARLEKELRGAWPDNSVRVINAGANGHLAKHMLARIDKDVAAHRPQLVIWQTGVNDAIKGVPIEIFKTELRAGIERIRALGADVMLVDQQFYPRFAKLKDGPLYVAAMREVAEPLKVPVIQRFRIMQHLIASAQFTTATLLGPDQFHLNDRSYDCIGRLLAQSLRSAAAATIAVSASTKVPAPQAPMPAAVQPVSDEGRQQQQM